MDMPGQLYWLYLDRLKSKFTDYTDSRFSESSTETKKDLKIKISAEKVNLWKDIISEYIAHMWNQTDEKLIYT